MTRGEEKRYREQSLHPMDIDVLVHRLALYVVRQLNEMDRGRDLESSVVEIVGSILEVGPGLLESEPELLDRPDAFSRLAPIAREAALLARIRRIGERRGAEIHELHSFRLLVDGDALAPRLMAIHEALADEELARLIAAFAEGFTTRERIERRLLRPGTRTVEQLDRELQAIVHGRL